MVFLKPAFKNTRMINFLSGNNDAEISLFEEAKGNQVTPNSLC